MKSSERVMKLKSNEIFERHQKRVDVFETVEFALIDSLHETIGFGSKYDRLICEIWIKINQIVIIFDTWLIRWCDLLSFQLNLIDILKTKDCIKLN